MSKATNTAVVEQWRSLQSSYLTTASALDRALDDSFDLGLSEFEILDLVADRPETECVMRDLVGLTPMTQSALSRVVDRLQKAGLIERNECSNDRRSMYVQLTARGREIHKGAQKMYCAMLAEQLGR